MTATGPSKLIRCTDFFSGKDSQIRSPNTRYRQFSASGKTRGQQPAVELSNTGQDIDGQLRAFEINARNKFVKLKKSLKLNGIPPWLDRKLEQAVFPTLQRLGYDRLMAGTLFEISPSDWKFMGSANEKTIVLHPEIQREIKEVIRGLAPQTAGTDDHTPRLAHTTPAAMIGTLDRNFSPEHLLELLNKIDTSWITLPRAYAFLERNHSRYLPQYLKTIESRASASCLAVFSRITLEFLGNFALKFADRHHSQSQLEKLLFYGYAAIYWKTLRKPSPGMENSAVFEHVRNWTRRLVCRSEFLGDDEMRYVYQMSKMKSVLFPGSNIHQKQPGNQNDGYRFLVTLRHGSVGAAALLRYYGIDQFLETRQILGQSPFQSKQNHLHRLLFALQTKYHLESKITRRNIRQFIGDLKAAYKNSQPAYQRPERRFLYRTINNLHILLNK